MSKPSNKYDLMPDKDDDVKPFVLASLSDRDGDLSKRWYVYYKVWDTQKNALIKKQVYVPAELKTEKERRRWGVQTVKEINAYLNQGFVINKEFEEEKPDTTTIIKIAPAVEQYIKNSKLTLKHRSYITCKNRLEMFLRWCEMKGIKTLKINAFTKKMAYQFMDWLVSGRKDEKGNDMTITGNTYNHYLDYKNELQVKRI
jgi:hypothetical protein